MRIQRIAICVLLAAAGFAPRAAAAAVGLTQLDSSRLLVSQSVDAWVAVTDDQGEAIEGLPREAFRLSESGDGRTFRAISSFLAFQPRAGAANGISFLLLLDNSGSMYDTLDGRPTTDPSVMRITLAKEAVRSFLDSMTNPRDRVGLVSFNTFFTVLSPPVSQRETIGELLDRIPRPAPDQAYTELYASLSLAAQQFAGIRGRKAIIVLSDGENYPYAQYTGREHPVFHRKLFLPTESILSNQEEGVSVYGINYGTGTRPDQNLQEITRQTGGQMFSAANREELAGVYSRIHQQVASEYLLTYRATVDPGEKRYVRVVVTTAGSAASATRFYIAGTVLGLPLPRLTPLLVIPFLLALALLWLLTALRLERKPGPARLEVLATRFGHPLTRVVALGGARTVIGSSPTADLTIAGSPTLKQEHVTILKDPSDETYSLMGGDRDVTVNNQPATSRPLEPGDVIEVGGSTIVFEGEETNGESSADHRGRPRRGRRK